MALAATPFIPQDGALVITDNTGTPLSFAVQYEDGDFSWDNVSANQKAMQIFKSRGRTYSARETDDVEIEFSFSAHATCILGDATTAGLYDVVAKKGVWASATSMLPQGAGGGAGLFCVTVKWTGERSNFGATADSTVTFKYCRLTMGFSEGTPGKISIKGTLICYSTDYLTVA